MTRQPSPEQPEGKKSVPELEEAIRLFLLKKEKTEEEIAKILVAREKAWKREPSYRLKPEHAAEMEIIFWENVLKDFRRIGISSEFQKNVFGSPKGEGFHQNEPEDFL